MPVRVKLVIALILSLGAWSIRLAAHSSPTHSWIRFSVYLAAILLSSGLKVAMPRGDGTLSVNFPFILLGIIQLSPAEALALAALSVFAQCRIRVLKAFTLVQISFNVANTVTSTMFAALTFAGMVRLHVELAPALSIAAAIYFLANSIPVAFVIGWSKGEAPLQFWLREFPWYLPFYLVGGLLAVTAHLISIHFGWTTSLLLVPLVYTIYRAYQGQMTMIRNRQQHLEETEALHLRTIEGLAMAIEAKDQGTHDHLLRVRVYVSEIGKALGLDELDLKALHTASFLHDIGKLAVPEHILNKPGKLTPEEFDKIKIHPVVGADILERVRFPYPVVPIVRSHHEAWDGSGYPDGLKGEEIPIAARILTAVDCFDALASDRPYRKALPLDKVMSMLREKAGTQFDPRVIEVLSERHMELEKQARLHKESIVALKTEVAVWRGAAPAAGFQQDNAHTPGTPDQTQSPDTPQGAADTHLDSLHLIAAAREEAQAIFEIGQMLGNSLSPSETTSVMSARLRRLIPFTSLALYLKDGDFLTSEFLDGETARHLSTSPIPLGEGLSGWVGQSGKPILNGNPKVEPNFQTGSDTSASPNSALALPLFNLSRDVFGVLTLYSNSADGFSRDHLRILQAIESKFSLSLANALRFSHSEKQNSVDSTTQLPNPSQFFFHLDAELNRSGRSGETLGIIVCDLNAFKAVNDQIGHHTGDLLLRSIAQRFRDSCRAYDTVARMGGDEFVFLLPGLSPDVVPGRLEKIQNAVSQACRDLDIHASGINVSVSAGAAFFPADGTTAEDLLGTADRRMYLSKRKHYETLEAPPEAPKMLPSRETRQVAAVA